MKAIQEFAEAITVCVGGVGDFSQGESGLEYVVMERRGRREQLQFSEQAQATEMTKNPKLFKECRSFITQSALL